jgi:hypothetical protein
MELADWRPRLRRRCDGASAGTSLRLPVDATTIDLAFFVCVPLLLVSCCSFFLMVV